MEKNKKLIPGLPTGFEDRWDKRLYLKKKLLKLIEENFIKYGFEPLETPSFEISENIGSFLADDDSNPMSDVFTFNDGEKNITLRYDLSSPLARFVAQNNQQLPLPYKRYAIQNVFRNEKAGNARYREFTQADCDIVGNVNPAQSNAELCNLIASTLINCGLKKDQFIINVSNRKIIQGLIQDLKIPEEKQVKVMRAIDKLDKPGFGLKGVEDLLKKERKDKSGAVTKGANLSDDQVSQIIGFLKIKDLKELKKNFQNSLTLEGSICSGGQYNKLISRFKGVDIPGTGFSIGVDRLLFAILQLGQIEVDSKKPAIVCVMDKKYLKNYYEILKILRDNGINSEIFLDSEKNLGKQLTYANKRGCPVAVICGENEFKENTITLKNLLGAKGENNQITIPKENLINEIKKFV